MQLGGPIQLQQLSGGQTNIPVHLSGSSSAQSAGGVPPSSMSVSLQLVNAHQQAKQMSWMQANGTESIACGLGGGSEFLDGSMPAPQSEQSVESVGDGTDMESYDSGHLLPGGVDYAGGGQLLNCGAEQYGDSQLMTGGGETTLCDAAAHLLAVATAGEPYPVQPPQQCQPLGDGLLSSSSIGQLNNISTQTLSRRPDVGSGGKRDRSTATAVSKPMADVVSRPAMTAPVVTGLQVGSGVGCEKQTAKIRPQVLTHIIEGFVIQEGPEPFPVSISRMSGV